MRGKSATPTFTAPLSDVDPDSESGSGSRGVKSLIKSGLRIRNDLFRIRIRIRIYLFFIPDPDPDPTRVLTIFYSFENFYLNFQVLKL